MLFDAGGSWRLLQSGSDFQFTFRSNRDSSIPYKTARFNPTFTAGDVQLSRHHFEHRSSEAVYPLEYPLDELLMIHLLSQGRGVEVHGCGLLDRAGRAYLFAGQSGAGKSTMARLWVDQPGVRAAQRRARGAEDGSRSHHGVRHAVARRRRAGRTPCGRACGRVFPAPRDSAHRLVPADGARAAAQLLACSFLPFHTAGPIDRTVTAVERVTRDAPCYDLWFAPDQSVIDALASHMR